MEFNATLIGEMLSFALLIWFCVHFIWPYLNKAIEERQVKIAEGLSAAERAHAGVHGVHADTPAGNLRDLLRCREARTGEQSQNLVFAQLRLGGVDDAVALRARQHALAIDAAAVVGHANDNGRAVAHRAEDERPRGRLPRRFALLRRLDTVIDGETGFTVPARDPEALAADVPHDRDRDPVAVGDSHR